MKMYFFLPTPFEVNQLRDALCIMRLARSLANETASRRSKSLVIAFENFSLSSSI